VEIAARVEARRLHLALRTRASGFGPVEITPFSAQRFSSVILDTGGTRRILKPVREHLQLTGGPFGVYRWRSAESA